MLARLQRITTILLLAGSLLWLLGCWWLDAPAWVYSGASLPLLSHVPVLAAEFLILRFVPSSDPRVRPSIAALLRAWIAESWLAMVTFYWRQPFRAEGLPDTIGSLPVDAGPSPTHAPVVLVHGLLCNRGFWLPVLQQLRVASIPYIAVNLEPVFTASIDDYVPIIERAVREATSASGHTPVLVAHSMGGLAVRAWSASRDDGTTRGSMAVRQVITIGTPHDGTWLARWSRAPMNRQMRRGSTWLAGLRAREAAMAPDRAARFTCFYSDCDNVVMPSLTATMPGADNRPLPGAAHVELAFRREVLQEIVRHAALAAA